MQQRHAASNIFMLILMTVGIVMTVFSAQSLEKLPKTCTSPQVLLSLNSILALSIIIMILPIAQFTCQYSCVNCDEVSNMNYSIILMFLSVGLVAASSTLLNGLRTDKSTCSKDEPKTFAITILVIALCILLWNLYKMTHHHQSVFG